jgi:hypothetical protein
MFVTIVIAALIVDGVFGLAGLIPTGPLLPGSSPLPQLARRRRVRR